jgi:type I restriction enzyme M protein
MCDDLLVPLVCGATNVTMDSNQLNDVLVPVPAPSIQDEVIESHLIRTTATEMATAANSLRQSSADANVIQITERVISDVEDLLNATKDRATIARFLPQ